MSDSGDVKINNDFICSSSSSSLNDILTLNQNSFETV